jgi:hypothetical protein
VNHATEDVADSFLYGLLNSSVDIGVRVSNVSGVDAAVFAKAVLVQSASGSSEPGFALTAFEVLAHVL